MDGYTYQYGIGSIVFVAGLIVGARQGYIGLRGSGLRNLLLMLGGLTFFMVLQGYLQYAPMETRPAVTTLTAAGGETAQPGHIGEPVDFVVMGLYLLIIVVVGLTFGRHQRTTKDFFFGGQRFSWWLIAFSLVATLVGSYSFVKYGEAAFSYGTASTQSYLNDWALMPLLLFGWLPILYFSRVTSIPEYFGRRFGNGVRLAATVSVLI